MRVFTQVLPCIGARGDCNAFGTFYFRVFVTVSRLASAAAVWLGGWAYACLPICVLNDLIMSDMQP